MAYSCEAFVEFDVVKKTMLNVTVFDMEGNVVFNVMTEEESFNIPVLPIGQYNLTVVNLETEDFAESSDSVRFNVVKANSSVTIHPIDDIAFNNGTLVEFDVENLTALNIIIFDVEGNIAFNATTESTIIYVPVLAVGRYNVTVVNLENENITESSDSAIFNVVKAGSSISLYPVFDAIYNVGFDIKFDVENRTVVNAAVFDVEGNMVFNVSTENTVVSIPTLAVGQYDLTVTNLESENITESSDSASFNVLKAGSSVVIHPIGDVVFDVGAIVDFDLENSTEVNVTIFDGEGNIVFSVIVGSGPVSLPILAIGQYNLTVLAFGSENYKESSDSVLFNVVRAGSSVIVHPIGDVVYGNGFDIGFDVVNRTMLNVTVFDSEGNAVFNQIAQDDFVSIPVLAPGQYNLTVINQKSDEIAKNSDSVVFNVLKANSSVLVHPVDDVIFGNEFDISFDVENVTVVNLTVFDMEGNAVFNATAEGTVVSVSALAVGQYNLTVIGLGSENYTESSDSVLFNVVKAGSSVVIHPIGDMVFGNGFDIGFDVENVTVVNLTLFDMGVNAVFNAITESTVVSIPALAAGRYNATVVGLASEDYAESSDSVVFNIIKAGSSVVVHPVDDMVYGSGVLVEFDLENSTAVNITVFDDNGEIAFSIIADSSPVSIQALAAGKYNLTVTGLESENYTESSDSLVFNVFKTESSINIELVQYQRYGYGINVEISGEYLTIVNIALVDESYQEVFSQNTTQSNMTLTILPVGKYIIKATNYGNESVSEANMNKIFHIAPMDTILTINVGPKDITYGEESIINFLLTDVKGKNVTGSIEMSVEDQNYTVDVVEGVGILKVNRSAGYHTVTADYLGDDNYKASNAATQFYVNRLGTQIIFKDMITKTVGLNDGKVGEYFVWTLKDSNGKPMANIPMLIGFNGVIYDETDGIVTDENGTTRLQINLAYKGIYTFAICFLGDEHYNASFDVAKITVLTQTPSLTLPNKSYKATAKTKTLSATFKSAKGTPIVDKWITFTVNGNTYKVKTNEKGVANVKISLNKIGTYKVTAKYAGDSTYAAITKTATLKLT